MLYCVIVLLCVFLTPLNAQQYSFFSGLSSTKTADVGIQLQFPLVEARIYGHSDFSNTEKKKIELQNWSLQVGESSSWQISAGNLSLSGIFSRFNNPTVTVPSAFKSYGVSESGLKISKPSFSSSRSGKTAFAGTVRFSYFDLFAFARMDRELEFADIKSIAYPIGIGASIIYPKKDERRGAPLELSVTVLAGHSSLQAKENDSWYLDYPYFAKTSTHYVLSEICVITEQIELFSSNGFSEHPLGELYFFTRNELSWTMYFFTLNVFFSYIDNGYIPANGSQIHKSLHGYINPQFLFPLNDQKSRHFRLGFLSSVQYEHSAEKHSLPVFSGDIKANLAFLGTVFSIHSENELRNIDPLNDIVFSKESLIKSKLSLAYKNSPIKSNFFLSIGGRYEMEPYTYIFAQLDKEKTVFLDVSTSVSPLQSLYLSFDSEIEFTKDSPIPVIGGEIEYTFRKEKTIADVSLSIDYIAKKDLEVAVQCMWRL